MLLIIRDEGRSTSLLTGLGADLHAPLEHDLHRLRGVAVGLVYSYLPFMVLPIYASLEKLDFRLVEAAYDLYANRCKVLRRVIIPLAMPGIIAGCILVFIPAWAPTSRRSCWAAARS